MCLSVTGNWKYKTRYVSERIVRFLSPEVWLTVDSVGDHHSFSLVSKRPTVKIPGIRIVSFDCTQGTGVFKTCFDISVMEWLGCYQPIQVNLRRVNVIYASARHVKGHVIWSWIICVRSPRHVPNLWCRQNMATPSALLDLCVEMHDTYCRKNKAMIYRCNRQNKIEETSVGLTVILLLLWVCSLFWRALVLPKPFHCQTVDLYEMHI